MWLPLYFYWPALIQIFIVLPVLRVTHSEQPPSYPTDCSGQESVLANACWGLVLGPVVESVLSKAAGQNASAVGNKSHLVALGASILFVVILDVLIQKKNEASVGLTTNAVRWPGFLFICLLCLSQPVLSQWSKESWTTIKKLLHQNFRSISSTKMVGARVWFRLFPPEKESTDGIP